jgi:hypothetical protein
MYSKYKAWKQNSGKYKGYNLASHGDSLKPFVEWIKNWSTLKVNNVFEIGANFAQDARISGAKLWNTAGKCVCF